MSDKKELGNNSNNKKSYISILMLSLEVLTTVFSLIVLLWQFALAINVHNENSALQLTKSYIFLVNNLINFEMVSDVILVSKNETCTPPYDPYHFLEIDGISNTCIQDTNGVKVLRFEKECHETLTYPQPVIISNILDKKMCYITNPKAKYKYTFKELGDSCKQDQLTCGSTNDYIICLEINDSVDSCPIIELWFYNENEIKELFNVNKDYLTNISYFKEINKTLYSISFTTSKYKFMTFRIKLETFSDIKYYNFYEDYGYYFDNDSETTFNFYYSEFDKINNYIDFNTYYKGKVSDTVSTMLKLNSEQFFKWYNTSNSSNIIFFHETIDPQLSMKMGASYFSAPNDTCIEYLFLNNTSNNDRGLFAVLSDISFEFLDLNLIYFITWTFIQAGTFYIYSFVYRIGILSDRINNVLKEIDKTSENITVLTLKGFYYISLLMKLLILYNINNAIEKNIIFLQYLETNKCFSQYHTINPQLIDDSLIHLNIRRFLKEPSLEKLRKKGNLIFHITFIEIANELISLIFYGLKTIYKL